MIGDMDSLLNDLTSKYRHVNFVNLSIGSLGIFEQSCDSFIEICSDLTIDKAHANYIITKLTSIMIRTTYYIFCNPGLTQTFYPTNSFLSSFSSSYQNHLPFSGFFLCLLFTYSLIFSSLEMPVIRSAEYKSLEGFVFVC